MGVKGCYRSGCSNIMCDTYIDGAGYLCSECQTEFEEFMKDKETEMTREYFLKFVKQFMSIPKGEYNVGDKRPWQEFLR